jgi:O-antigen biosynthesis protein
MMACELPVVEIDAPSTRAIYRQGEVTFAAPNPNAVADAVHQVMAETELTERQVAARGTSSLGWTGARA